MKTLVIYNGPSQMPGPGYGEPIVAFLTAGSNCSAFTSHRGGRSNSCEQHLKSPTSRGRYFA